VATVPLIAAVLYRAVGAGEHFDARRLTGLFIGFAGVAALVGIDVAGTDPLAVAEMLVVALCYASGPLIISRRLAGLPTLGVITASLALTAVGYAPAGLLSMPASVSAQTVGAVAALTLVCTVIAFLVFFALIREVGPSRSTVITYVNPLVAVLLGVIILSEPLTLGIAVGMPLILLGSVLGTAPSLRKARAPSGERTVGSATDQSASPPTP
jgi:drug/metabolite transporter (DMT)-like permease